MHKVGKMQIYEYFKKGCQFFHFRTIFYASTLTKSKGLFFACSLVVL